ncbi:MAG: response regulator [Synergistaceae bacterium]|nr:response regulator [Synergistaceae bacterium]
MKYTAVIVEDEPGATKYLTKIVNMRFPQFKIVACGEDGEQGLILVETYRPDLIFTDIRMPKMDGLEMIKAVYKRYPQICAVIVSGYQDFEYAKTALQHGAADYLLKPVTPSSMEEVIGRILPVISQAKYQRCMHVIRRMIRGEVLDEKELLRAFPSKRYMAAIARKNGLPSRFLTGASAEILTNNAETGVFYGRDEMESIYIIDAESITIEEILKRSCEPRRKTDGYMTTVVCGNDISVRELPSTIRNLFKTLDSSCSIGHSQIITVSNDHADSSRQAVSIDNNDILDLETSILEGDHHQIRNRLYAFLEHCKRKVYPQLFVEQTIRTLLSQVQARRNGEGVQLIEFLLDDAFFYATCYDDLQKSLLDIIERSSGNPDSIIRKIDTPEFFQLLQDYLDTHYSQPISLPDVCQAFGVSQAYISMLFRKYSGKTFISYLTSLRIEKAKELLQKRDVLIKDVAADVGYSDPFYFSTIFRSATGQSPSNYVLSRRLI